VFAIRGLEFGAVTRAESTRSVHLEQDDLTPPSPTDRFDRDRSWRDCRPSGRR
jgi:hypothetical protein